MDLSKRHIRLLLFHLQVLTCALGTFRMRLTHVHGLQSLYHLPSVSSPAQPCAGPPNPMCSHTPSSLRPPHLMCRCLSVADSRITIWESTSALILGGNFSEHSPSLVRFYFVVLFCTFLRAFTDIVFLPIKCPRSCQSPEHTCWYMFCILPPTGMSPSAAFHVNLFINYSFFLVQGIKPGVSHMLSMYSITKSHLQPHVGNFKCLMDQVSCFYFNSFMVSQVEFDDASTNDSYHLYYVLMCPLMGMCLV